MYVMLLAPNLHQTAGGPRSRAGGRPAGGRGSRAVVTDITWTCVQTRAPSQAAAARAGSTASRNDVIDPVIPRHPLPRVYPSPPPISSYLTRTSSSVIKPHYSPFSVFIPQRQRPLSVFLPSISDWLREALGTGFASLRLLRGVQRPILAGLVSRLASTLPGADWRTAFPHAILLESAAAVRGICEYFTSVSSRTCDTNSTVDNFRRKNPGRPQGKLQFRNLFTEAWTQAATPKNEMSGFKATGIFPFNPQVIPRTAFAPGDVSDHTPLQARPASSSTTSCNLETSTISVTPTALLTSNSTANNINLTDHDAYVPGRQQNRRISSMGGKRSKAGFTITRQSNKTAPTQTKIVHQPIRSKVTPTIAAPTKILGRAFKSARFVADSLGMDGGVRWTGGSGKKELSLSDQSQGTVWREGVREHARGYCRGSLFPRELAIPTSQAHQFVNACGHASATPPPPPALAKPTRCSVDGPERENITSRKFLVCHLPPRIRTSAALLSAGKRNNRITHSTVPFPAPLPHAGLTFSRHPSNSSLAPLALFPDHCAPRAHLYIFYFRVVVTLPGPGGGGGGGRGFLPHSTWPHFPPSPTPPQPSSRRVPFCSHEHFFFFITIFRKWFVTNVSRVHVGCAGQWQEKAILSISVDSLKPGSLFDHW
ncbi:hypothetical protein PR048_027716 [Dryococelus australis]|uniref:Uncharacterized protein n=1 Tax=Dryococelus australis TaxID=614101 RepID=A0ABQ9GHA1_9NEOP|nr:hypothetical protein PR048_027716 [Dryococelus australis]